MIGNDVKISKDGVVTGTVKYLSDVPDYDDGQKEGHYFPIKFDENNYDKPLHVGGKVVGDGFSAGKEITPSEKDPYLVIRVENCTDENKVTVYDSGTKEELFTLDFNQTTLAPPAGKYAITVPSQDRSFGAWGKASDFIDENLKIEWNGINGKAAGTVKWFEGNEKVKAGNHYPIVFDKYYDEEKQVDINGKKINAQDTIFNFEKTRIITIKYNGQKIAVLDFSDAKLETQPAKIKANNKTPVMSVPEDDTGALDYKDEEISLEPETVAEKRYTKSEINRMSTADLQALAAEKGVYGAKDMTGTELKSLLVEMLVN